MFCLHHAIMSTERFNKQTSPTLCRLVSTLGGVQRFILYLGRGKSSTAQYSHYQVLKNGFIMYAVMCPVQIKVCLLFHVDVHIFTWQQIAVKVSHGAFNDTLFLLRRQEDKDASVLMMRPLPIQPSIHPSLPPRRHRLPAAPPISPPRAPTF